MELALPLGDNSVEDISEYLSASILGMGTVAI